MIEPEPDHLHPLDRAGWSKSSYSESNGQCVEIKNAGHLVFLGDTKNNGHGHGPVIRFTQAQWENFLAAVVTEPASVQVDHVRLTRTGHITSITDTTRSVRLEFHQPEIDAFLLGARNGEFLVTTNEASGGALSYL